MIVMDARMPTLPTTSSEAKDPVCGMTVDPAKTPHRHIHRGETHFFCSEGCRAKFATDPGRYLGAAWREPATPTPASTIFSVARLRAGVVFMVSSLCW